MSIRDVYQEYYGLYREEYHRNLTPDKEAWREGFGVGVMEVDGKVDAELFVDLYLCIF